VQKTSMAIETQGFTIITSGFKDAPPLKGEATLMRYPHIKPLKKQFGKGLMENLTTRVSASKAKQFPLVDFIDTPGLVDGDVSYPMDVNNAIVKLADYADLVLVFMDPLGKALVSRTMQVVKALNKEHYHKLKYYMTKADSVDSQEDLLKVTVQITQNIGEYVDNKHGFEIPPIFLPDHKEGLANLPGRPKNINQIDKLTSEIEQRIATKVQDNLNKVEVDCDLLITTIDTQVASDLKAKEKQRLRVHASVFLYFIAWAIPTFSFLQFLLVIKSSLSNTILEAEAIVLMYEYVEPLAAPFTTGLTGEGTGMVAKIKYFFTLVVVFLVLMFLAKTLDKWSKTFKTKSDSQLEVLQEQKEHLKRTLKQRENLYTQYFEKFTMELEGQ